MARDNHEILDIAISVVKELARSSCTANLDVEIDKVYKKIKEISERDDA